MSLSDRFRDLRDRLGDRFELPSITISHTSTVRSDADRAAGRKGSSSTIAMTARGTLGSRKVFVSEGVYRQEATVRLDKPVLPDDVLTIGARTVTVLTVEETNPFGEDTAIIYLAVVK
ncbi:hypothetical protein SAMN05518849_11681 [Sphingobium sp. AP50]|uniref:hypothetical protein n=1 Tax=Sphingobium sp. AP50 TaxID=1884369 RepID=UPI0008B70EF2|nr:hypothetical protein [Sphingobium sp. AP50]SEJ87470.1 hypothetical protein SAMN05518849_11681 [Sphingobium sp. AP50]